MAAATVKLEFNRRRRSANVLTTTAVHLYHYCNITRPRVWRICSSRGCLQHSTLQAAAALHRPPACKSARVYFAKFVHSCRERRTAPQLAAGSAALQLSQLATAGALQQLAAGPRHCSQCCRLSTSLPAHCRWSGYAVFTLGFCTMNTFQMKRSSKI